MTIISPSDGATLVAKRVSKLEYEVKPVVKADHVHLDVDGDEVGMSHTLKGKFTLGPLKAGTHKVCVRPVSKALRANDDETKTCREFTLEGVGQTSRGYAPNQRQQDPCGGRR